MLLCSHYLLAIVFQILDSQVVLILCKFLQAKCLRFRSQSLTKMAQLVGRGTVQKNNEWKRHREVKIEKKQEQEQI